MICPVSDSLGDSEREMDSRRRGCGNVGIRRFGPDFQGRWEGWETRFLSFPGFPRRVISTAWRSRFFRERQRLSWGRVLPYEVRSVDDTHPTVEVLAHPHARAGQRPPPARLLDLIHLLIQLHRMIPI